MNKKQKKVAVKVGVGVAALAAAAAAGTYFFGGKRGAKNRARVAKWADSAKKDVVKKLKGMGKVTQKSYSQAVDAVLAQYKKAKKVSPAELLALASELKGQWNNITAEVSSVANKIVPRIAKKSATKKAPAQKKSSRK